MKKYLSILFAFILFLTGWCGKSVPAAYDDKNIVSCSVSKDKGCISNVNGKETNDVDNTEEFLNDSKQYKTIGSTISDFPIVMQMPELPTGCEITALTMILQYYGFPAEKTSLAFEYLPTVPSDFYYDDSGNMYGPDLREYFVGEPSTIGGFVCGTGAICATADSYLAEQESDLRAVDISGRSPEALYELIDENIPVLVWVTIEMADRRQTQGWYTASGEYVEWSTNDHGAVLIGYDEETVTIADPISGEVKYDRAQFEKVFSDRGSQCVILQ